MSLFKSITLIAFLAMALSCSVKENRGDCMCCLGLDYSDCIDKRGSIVLTGWDDRMQESIMDIPDPGSQSAYREYYVPRCDFTLSVSSGADITDGRYVMTRPGEQADSLYSFLERFRTDGEYCFRKIVLNKQFTTIRVINAVWESTQDSIVVCGNSVGLYLPEMTPVPGRYSLTVHKSPGGIFPFRLYRQTGNLIISIPTPKALGGMKEINLSGILDQCGYDWSEASLRDVDLYLDKSLMQVYVQISDWSSAGTIIVEI